MARIISKIIEPGETIVRCLLESYLKSKSQPIPAYKALEPKVNENDISMLRLDYTDRSYCIGYGQNLSGASKFRGLLYLTPNIVDGVNQWARSGISAEDISGNRENNGISSRFVYSPLDKNRNPLPTDIDLTNDTSNGDCPMHCDLRFSERRIEGGQEEVLNTRIRKYAEQLKDRVMYQIATNPVTGELGEMEHGEIFEKFNETPVLSIIIPFYKAAKYIELAAKSVLSQAVGKPVEVIFINDGDFDCFKVLKPIIDSYPREAIYFGQKNKGVAIARNRGMELARGEYLWFVDADDTIADGAIDSVLYQISQAQSQVLMFRMDDYDEDGNPVMNTRSFYQGNEPVECDGVSLILKHFSYSPVQMCIFQKQFMVEHDLHFEEIAPHDLEIMPRLMIRAKNVRIVPQVIYHYYHHYNNPNHKSKYTIWRTENHLAMLDQYDRIIENTIDARIRKALYITQFRQMRHILHDPELEVFKKNYEKWEIKRRMPQIRRILRKTFCMIDSPSHFLTWCLWFISPMTYKKLQYRGKYGKKK